MVTMAEIGWNVFDKRAIAGRHPFYARLRREAPIIHSAQLESWVLTRYEDVRTVLRDPAQWSSFRLGDQRGARPDQHREQVPPAGTLTMLNSDPPDHTRL